jgi:hypothetical protein
MTINTFHSGGWRLSLSNLPLTKDYAELSYFDNFCKSVILPDYNLMEYFSYGPDGEMERHPLNHKNDNLTPLQIDWKVCEDFKNYLFFFQWMLSLRYGEIDTKRDDRLWHNVIDRINIELLSNQGSKVADLYYTDARLVSISSLPLDYGVQSEITFTTNFTYREVGFNLVGS